MDNAGLIPIERTFLLEYARFRMLVEAEVIGIEEPGIEFWLLGFLHLATLNDYRLALFATPGASWHEKHAARSSVQATLASRGIDAARLGAILRTLLSQGAGNDPCLARRYLNGDDPLAAILDDPTDTAACALARLCLVTVLKAWYETALEEAHQLSLGDSDRESFEAFEQIDCPDLLCDLALHAYHEEIRRGSLMKLHRLGLLHGPDMRRMLDEIAANDTQPGVRGLAMVLLRKLPQEPTPRRKPDRPRDLRHSVLNPDLEALCAWGMLDPADPDDLDLIEYLYRDHGCTEYGSLIPEDRRRRSRKSYFRLRGLVSKEFDVDVLERYVLKGDNMELRAFSFCRLNGWAHWEMDDQNSCYGYECGHVPDYPAERALRLCARLSEELDTYPPYYDVHSAMGARDALCEGAYKVAEKLRYGRNLCDEMSFVGQLAREEAAARGVEREGIEFWMLGSLRFAQMSREDLQWTRFPFLFYDRIVKEAKRCHAAFAAHDIDPRRFEPLLRGVLAEGAPSDPDLPSFYFATAERECDWYWFRPADLVKTVLKQPTDTLCLALMRLGLLMTLEARLPRQLRNIPRIPYTPGLFEESDELTSVDLWTVDFSGITSLKCLFFRCRSLRHIDLAPLEDLQVTNMEDMFAQCRSLEEIDLTPLDTSQVTTMGSLFSGCESLTHIDLTSLDTSQVTDLSHLFTGCTGLTELDLSSLDTSKVTDMNALFWRCENLRSINLAHLDTRQVRNMGFLFKACRSLKALDLSSLDTARVTNMRDLFAECTGLTELDLSSLDTTQVSDMYEMFAGCTGLTELDVSSLDTARVTDMRGMFTRCTGLTRLDVSNFDTSSVRRADDMFRDCKALEEIVGLETLDLSHVKWMGSMFSGCSALGYIDLGNCNVPSDSFTYGVFKGCSSLESWCLPASWPTKSDWKDSLPEPTASCGKWWAVEAQAWMDLDEIRGRLAAGIVDTYTSESRERSGARRT